MSFIHFGFVIAGAAAMTLPILIHLLLKQRARPMEIGSIRFIRNVVQRTKARQRIRRWLLLAMRAAAMLLIGLLFARPFLPDTPVDGRTREVAVLIDRSASMSAQHDNGSTAMDTAVRRAQQLIASLGDRARVHIGLFDASGVTPVAVSELSQAQPASTGTRFDDAIGWASDVLSSSDRRDQSVLLLSDLQRRGLQSLGDSVLPPDVPVRIEDPAPAITQNLAIESVVPIQVELRPGVPVAIAIRVLNAGAFPVSNVPIAVRLTGEGRPIEISRSLSLAAGQRQTLELELPIKDAGIYQGQASIDRDDPIAHDNQRFVAFQVRHPDRVLLVDGDPGRKPWESSTYFVETALRLQTPVGDGPPQTYEIERLVWDQGLGFPDLTGFRLIVIANLGRFRTTDAKRLREFVDGGGNVLWFMGERTNSAVMQPVFESGLLDDTTLGTATDALARVSEFDQDHPALQPFVNPQHGDLRSLSVRRFVPIDSLSPKAEVLLQSRQGPLAIAFPTGQGKFVLITSSADRNWSEWPQNRLFVPLIRQLTAWLTGQLDARQPVIAEIINDASHSPGISQNESSIVVRNIDPAESDTGRLGVEQFREALGLPSETVVNSENEELKRLTPATAARADEKWPILVWTLMGLLGLELLLASRIHE